MPLVRHVPAAQTDAPKTVSAVAPVVEAAKEVVIQKAESKPYTGREKAEAPMTKDDYWRRREERDIETGTRIRRSGVWQAALQSVGVLQYSPDVRSFEDYLKAVRKAAEDGLKFVEERE